MKSTDQRTRRARCELLVGERVRVGTRAGFLGKLARSQQAGNSWGARRFLTSSPLPPRTIKVAVTLASQAPAIGSKGEMARAAVFDDRRRRWQVEANEIDYL